MINLLPIEDKKLIKKEFFRRFFIVFGLGFLILFFVELVFVSVFFSLVDSFEGVFDKQMEDIKNLTEAKNMEEFEKESEILNRFLTDLSFKEKFFRAVSEDISIILKNTSSSIKINTILFDRDTGQDLMPQILLKGHAETRNNLLGFIEKLKLENSFAEVISPVSNLLLERDINFLLTVKLKNEQL